MKRTLIFFTLIFSISVVAIAKTLPVPTTVTTTKDQTTQTRVERMPMHIDIKVYYDSDTHSIDVIGADKYIAEVFIYDAAGKVESYSPFLNSTLPVVTTGTHRIFIQSENWYAEGQFNAL